VLQPNQSQLSLSEEVFLPADLITMGSRGMGSSIYKKQDFKIGQPI